VLLSRIRRWLLTAAAILMFVVFAGATYQGVATALERRKFPHPGRMVKAGEHQLHIYCSGKGSPTVVLEAGAAGMSAAWGWVQPQVATMTRVCSYDRAGLGWSEAGDDRYEPGLVAPALQALLTGAGEQPPFIVVGHGLGAAFATMFASRFGDQVAALVLIDPPKDAPRMPRAGSETRLVNASPWLARAGILRATKMMSKSATGLPNAAAGPLKAFLNRPDHLTRSARELSQWDDAVALAREAPLREDLPVVRVVATGDDQVAFLTDAAQAGAATTAVLGAVAAARSTTP
jgi:pimeloyl-ACP methyl ester carboxylesterase